MGKEEGLSADMLKEIELCKNDPHYFFTKYVTIDGKQADTYLSKQLFNDLVFNYTKALKIKAMRCR